MVSPRRVLVAEVGGGDVRRLVEVASRTWRDAGFEVIRLGVASSSAVAEAALQEDVDAVALPGASAGVADQVAVALDGRGLRGVAVLGSAELPDPRDPTSAAALAVAIERAARHPEPEPAP